MTEDNVIPMNTPTPPPLRLQVRVLSRAESDNGPVYDVFASTADRDQIEGRSVVIEWSAPDEVLAVSDPAGIETAVANLALERGALAVRLVEAAWDDGTEQESADTVTPATSDDEATSEEAGEETGALGDLLDARRITKTLPCGMTDAERSELAMRMTELTLEIEDIEAQQKRIKGLRERITAYAHDVESGNTMRAVTCFVYFDTPAPGMKRIIRADTGEIVEEVTMSQADMQPSLFESTTDETATDEGEHAPTDTADEAQQADGDTAPLATDDAEEMDGDDMRIPVVSEEG